MTEQNSITVQRTLFREVQEAIKGTSYSSVAEFAKHWVRIGLVSLKNKQAGIIEFVPASEFLNKCKVPQEDLSTIISNGKGMTQKNNSG